LRLTLDDTPHVANIATAGIDRYAVTLNDRTIDIAVVERQNGSVRFTAMGLQQTARFALSDDVLHLDLNGTTIAVRETPLEAAGAARRERSGRLVAPMNGAIVAVFAKPGDRVSRGQRIVVLEAMKMQHEIGAERDGTVGEILVKPGDQVATRQVLAVLAPEPATAQERRTEETP
jgi:geranyl-CoA carboxylase alpha subunit